MKTNILISIFGVCLLFFILECISIAPHYEKQMAEVRSIEEDPDFGFIGEDYRTLVKFKDGHTQYIGGKRGEVGEMILVDKVVGRSTLFGIFAEHSQISNK